MFAIVTVLDERSDALVRSIWQELETNCGLTGFHLFPIPHFSWQGADDYDIPAVEQCLSEIAKGTTPISIAADGLGIFTGPRPVIYIPLARTIPLARLHRTIWTRVKMTAQNLNAYYSPELWMPHITLGLMDVDHDNLVCAIRELGSRPLKFNLKVDNLAVVSQEGDQVGGLLRRFNLKGT